MNGDFDVTVVLNNDCMYCLYLCLAYTSVICSILAQAHM